MSAADRCGILDRDDPNLSIRAQCAMLGLSRSGVYRPRPANDDDDLALMRRIDELFLRPRSSARAGWQCCRAEGGGEPQAGAAADAPDGDRGLGPSTNTSKPAPGHKIFPYLLRDLTIDRANQVWAADITYVPIGRGFLYLVAVIDWASRAVLAWRLSNTLDTRFCIDALEEALARFGTPEIFNTDQGSQFTSTAFTGRLAAAGIQISMDGRGRWMDNVFIERLWRSLKYEDIYLKGYADGREAKAGIANWISFYNGRRPHQALGNRTPMAVWRDGVTGALGDKAVDMTLRHGRSLDNADALPTGPQPQQQQTGLVA